MHCPPDDLCATCWDDQHAREHPRLVEGCFACKLSTVQVNARVAGNGQNRPPRQTDNPWERGRAGEFRADGSFMPYLSPDLSATIGVKQFAEKRHLYEPTIRRRRQLTEAGQTGTS